MNDSRKKYEAIMAIILSELGRSVHIDDLPPTGAVFSAEMTSGTVCEVSIYAPSERADVPTATVTNRSLRPSRKFMGVVKKHATRDCCVYQRYRLLTEVSYSPVRVLRIRLNLAKYRIHSAYLADGFDNAYLRKTDGKRKSS